MKAAPQLDSTSWTHLLPNVQLDVRQAGVRAAIYALDGVEFLIGSAIGCDLRLSVDAPPILCSFARHPQGLRLRRFGLSQSILVNGEPCPLQIDLAEGDVVQAGSVEIVCHIHKAQAVASPALEQTQRLLQSKLEQFRQQVQHFQDEKEAFEKHRASSTEAERSNLSRELSRREHVLKEREAKLRLDEHDATERRLHDDARHAELERRAAELTQRTQSLAEERRIHEIRTKQAQSDADAKLADLALLDKSISERSRELDAKAKQYERDAKLRSDEHDAAERRQRDDARHAELERRAAELAQRSLKLEEERRTLEERSRLSQSEADAKLDNLTLLDKSIAERSRELEAKVKQYEADILRLNRLQGEIELREAESRTRHDDATKLHDQLRVESAELEEQVNRLEVWRSELEAQSDQLSKQKQEQDAHAREFAERAATLEGQQATLAMLRGRLERMREEVRKREDQLDAERERQKVFEAELTRKAEELRQLEADARADKEMRLHEQKQWSERGAVMEEAVRQLKSAQEKLNADRRHVEEQALDIEQARNQLAETESLLHSRIAHLAETRDRLDLERHTLQQRSVLLLEREEACAALQEQLHKRSDELDSRRKEVEQLAEKVDANSAMIDAKASEIGEREQQLKNQIETWRRELESKAEILRQKHSEAAGYEDRYQEQMNLVNVQRQAHASERAEFQEEQRRALEDLAKSRTEIEAIREEARTIIADLPDAELRANAVAERLGLAREQLRNHLAEIHQYVRQCQDDLTQLRGRLQSDLDSLQGHEQSLRKQQDEHRLALAAYRQHLVEWQGQIAELRRTLARGETRLERKQAQVHEQTRVIQAESHRLAQHAEELEQQQRDVADRREEIDRHLVDMRDWYRRKLRDLAGIPLVPDMLANMNEPAILHVPATTDSTGEDDDAGIIPTNRSILALKSADDEGDDRLGRLLRDAQLIDGDTLTALLAEARRQRRSLRQVLLASGVITLYQLALIETGNLAGLMLGPVRVVDRMRTSPHEMVYRVFDPRRGVEAVLRHLAESDLADAVKPDEFRQRFRQAMLNDPHVANTLDVFELGGRPAALQEWLTGLTATDWPPLAAAPGVCWRLLTQAAQGLAAGHRAGLVHGHLSEDSLLLTGEGVLKIRGLGEPAWLVGTSTDDEPSMREDLRALGRIASSWCTPAGVRKGPKTKPLPDALVSVLFRLAADGEQGYRDVVELLEDLSNAGDAIPPNAEAWDRLLKYIREHGASESPLRRSA